MQITNVNFNIFSKGKEEYQLKIDFIKEGSLTSFKTFDFKKNQITESEGLLVDIYSQNGIYSQKILKNLFKNSDFEGFSSAVKKMKELKTKGKTIVVLDIKGSTSYQSSSIIKAEKIVCDFFKSQEMKSNVSNTAKKIKELFPEPVDFIFCEGSLKKKLLTQFTPEQVDFLDSKEGTIHFCQIAEFFMNGFKFGYQALDIVSDDYIVSTSGKTFIPSKKSTVFYPSLYKDVYSINGSFAKTMSSFFEWTGEFDQTKEITVINIEEKQ